MKKKNKASIGMDLEQLEKNIRSAFLSRHEEETSFRNRKTLED
jgi:hypothetical protein